MTGNTPRKGFHRICPECGEDFFAKRLHGRFCGDKCRKRWNNRAAVRGVEVYHLLMNARYDRAHGGPMTALSRLAAKYREQDRRERGGRISWDGLPEIMARNVDLSSIVYRA